MVSPACSASSQGVCVQVDLDSLTDLEEHWRAVRMQLDSGNNKHSEALECRVTFILIVGEILSFVLNSVAKCSFRMSGPRCNTNSRFYKSPSCQHLHLIHFNWLHRSINILSLFYYVVKIKTLLSLTRRSRRRTGGINKDWISPGLCIVHAHAMTRLTGTINGAESLLI